MYIYPYPPRKNEINSLKEGKKKKNINNPKTEQEKKSEQTKKI